ncbi:hypothetical protein BGI05_03170 [Snodgrassella alvi]|uniref:hypothetical protein n=1 Tax=Snodgrassella alvi TaxID=1196083 RepID=UPI0009FE9E74|nr:hypothetical protein [Snodgrassella alvi]ORF04471.1 hypothetical protein BGH97_00680 [Snodgrassella alvi]ORF09653.1 hypothetical protein BGH99_01525 [Snodgrassella alvi]ORF10042.1 hypothetical protein BGI00_10730 [Snodgrassella alvi]ORF11307.1 hypothetical protein BGI02_10685 [Snodgrassella alvi]ORF21977.1 hypothetical protein BGI05_03170 [Snodgrassella alvi]
MFSPLFIVYILITLVGLVILSFIYKQYKKAMLEFYRMDIFELRDELFDYAAEGNISFDNESYQLMRTLLNGYLRYAENLDISRFQKFQKAVEKENLIIDNSFMQQYRQKSKALSVKQKEKLDKYLQRSALIAATYMIRKSIIYCIYLLFKSLFCKLISKNNSNSKVSWKNSKREKVKTINEELVTDIYEVGANAS